MKSTAFVDAGIKFEKEALAQAGSSLVSGTCLNHSRPEVTELHSATAGCGAGMTVVLSVIGWQMGHGCKKTDHTWHV